MQGIETGGGKGTPRKRRQAPRKVSPSSQPVGVLAPKPTGVFADTSVRPQSIAARPARKAAARPARTVSALDRLPSSRGGSPSPYRPAPARRVIAASQALKRQQQAEVRDTKTDSLSEKDRLAIVNKALDKLTEHVIKNQRYQGHGPADGYTPDHPLVRNLVRAGKIKVFNGGLGTGDAYGSAGPVGSGVLKVLDLTARPGHAIAGAADALVQHKGLGAARHAATRGIEGKDRTLFSDVLRHAGAPKAVQGVGGFALDVAADPTTYVTFGAGGVAEHAAEKAARDTAERAARAGMSEAGIRTVAARAAKRAAKSAPAGRGATVKFAGREVAGVRRGSAAVGRGVGRVGSKVAEAPGARRVASRARGVAGGARELTREVRPTLAPAGVDRQAFEGARRAARQARAATNLADRENQAFARGLQKAIGADNYEKVIRAIETRTVSKLKTSDPELHTAAVVLRSKFRHAKRLRAHAGLGEGTIRDYFPHARQDVLEQGLGISDQAVEGVRPRRGAGGRTVTRPGSAGTRSDRRGLHEINPDRVAEGKEPFSTNVPLVALNYLTETARTVAKSDFLKAMARTGRVVRPGQGTVHLNDGEAVYRLGFEPATKTSTHLADSKAGGEVVLRSGAGRGRFGLREVNDTELQRVLGHRAGGGNPPTGQYVVLDRRVVEDALTSTRPARAQHTSTALLDRTTGGFKRVATATPGFHVRNFVGDAQMAFLGQPGHELARNAGQAGRALRRVSEQEREAGRVTVGSAPSAKTIKVAGRRMPLDEFVAGAKKNGVIRSGYVGRELEDLTKGRVGNATKVKRGTGDRVKRWMQNREDLFRLATYKHGLDKGLSEEAAADLAAHIHIDYGDLTETERRVLRRAFPFYTFSARALPLHAQKLVTNPGKYATVEKAREEIGRSTGLSEEDQRNRMQLYQQRQAPFVVKIGDGPTAISAALPLTMLNEVPTSTNLGAYLDELGQFTAGMLNPVLKDPAELWANESTFFRKPIEDSQRPLVAAPSWVQYVPHKYWDGLGITHDYVDPRTGRRTWGWRGKADYIAKAVPGPVNLAQQLASPGTNRRGQGETAKVVAGLSGVRLDPLDEQAGAKKAVTTINAQLDALNRRKGMLNQQGVTARTPTPEYFRLSLQIRQLEIARDRALATAGGQQVQAGPPADPRATARAKRLAAHSMGSPAARARSLARARRAAARR